MIAQDGALLQCALGKRHDPVAAMPARKGCRHMRDNRGLGWAVPELELSRGLQSGTIAADGLWPKYCSALEEKGCRQVRFNLGNGCAAAELELLRGLQSGSIAGER